MSDKFMSEYYSWQNRFINAYKDSNVNPSFLQEMATIHPGITENLTTEKKISFVSSRMKNYNRRSTLKDGSIVYDRTPYIDDLFAFCKAKGITPNEVLLDSLRDTVSNFRKFTDIYDLLNMTIVGKKFFTSFKVESKDFTLQQYLPENLVFRLFFKKALVRNFDSCFAWEQGSGIKYPLTFDGSYKINDKSFLNLHFLIINFIKKRSNNSIFNFVFEHDEFTDVLFMGSDWSYSESCGFSIPIEVNYEKWNPKRHYLSSVNFYMFLCVLEALREMYKVEYENISNLNEIDYCINYLEKNEDMYQFCEKLFLGTFVIINQSAVIDISGSFIGDLDISKEDDERDDFDRRQDLPQSKVIIKEANNNSGVYEL